MKSICIIFAVVALVVISCSATDTLEPTNEPPSTGKPEVVDRLTDVHLTQAIIQVPPSFEGATLYVYFGGARRYLIM